MTDAELCVAVMGWKRLDEVKANVKRFGIEYCKAYMAYPDGVHRPPPDFAHDSRWAKKLARAACEKWDAIMTITCDWCGSPTDVEVAIIPRALRVEHAVNAEDLEPALRAAVVKVCEAHAAKE